MDYLFRRHYKMQPSASAQPTVAAPLVLLAEPEAEALAVYARHLTKANLLVNICLELSLLIRQVEEVRPHLLVLNPGKDIAEAISILQQVTGTNPGLPVITIGGAIPDHYLDRLMATGVALHLNRSLTQPRDIAVAAKQLLRLG
jgi:hypothetical protein